MLALVVILLLVLGWALIAGRLARYSVTAPLALLVAGIVLTAGRDPVFVFDIEFEAAERIIEVIVAILLFTDATMTSMMRSAASNSMSKTKTGSRPAVSTMPATSSASGAVTL